MRKPDPTGPDARYLDLLRQGIWKGPGPARVPKAGEALDLASDTFNRVRARLVDQRTPCAGCGAFSERDYVCAPFRA